MVELPELPEQLAPYRAQLAEVARPCFALRHVRGAAPVGAGKVGGYPDLPDGLPWPVNDDGVPLPFVFQVDVPGQGLVQFFSTFVSDETWADDNQWRDDWLEDDGGDNRILVHRDPAGLAPRTDGPAPFQEEWRLDPQPDVSLPEYIELHYRQPDLLAAFRADKELRDAYRDFVTYELTFHQGIGGYPRWLQDLGYSEAVARERGLLFADVYPRPPSDASRALQAELIEAGGGWALVCQLDSILGEDGRLYLLAPLDGDGRFDLDRVQFVYQCT